MIAIVNVSEKPTQTGWNDYEVRINRLVVTEFKHRREDGLAVCLQLASEAVEKQKWLDMKDLFDAMGGENEI